MTQNTNQFGFKTILKGFLNAFNMERGLIPTLRDLLLRPSKVVNYYIEGNKEKYFSPGRFFVTAFAIYAIFILLFPSIVDLGMDYAQLEEIGKNNLPFLENNPMIVYALFLIPINAIISRLSFYTYELNLAKHFVIHIYCMSFLLIFTSLIMLPFDLLFQDELNKLVIDEMLDGDPLQLKLRMLFSLGISTLIQIIYYAFALKQIFQIKTYSAILKSLLLYLGFLVSLMLVGLSHGILNSYAAHH